MASERNTVQKQAIYDALVSLGHPSATELYENLRATHPTISRGTVFRVLSAFAETGRAKRLCFPGSDDRFDATLTPHAHAVCRVCGTITDVYLSDQLRYPFPDDGFLPERYELEVTGICKACREKETY